MRSAFADIRPGSPDLFAGSSQLTTLKTRVHKPRLWDREILRMRVSPIKPEPVANLQLARNDRWAINATQGNLRGLSKLRRKKVCHQSAIASMSSHRILLRQALLARVFWGVSLTVLVPTCLYAQTRGVGTGNNGMINPVTQGPSNPANLIPFRVVDYPEPTRYGVKLPDFKWLRDITWLVSPIYVFSNQRSRIGGISLNDETVALDVSASLNRTPYTSLDVLYGYTSATGESPNGTIQATSQHAVSASILQPLDLLFPWEKGWEPIVGIFQRTESHCASQFAIIEGIAYGRSFTSTDFERSGVVHGSSDVFGGTSLLDFQYAWRKNVAPDETYADLFIEASSGLQANRFDVNSFGGPPTSGRQIDYQTRVTLNRSIWRRVGIFLGVEWDAPIDSGPVRGTRTNYANTATFTTGLTYNYNPGLRYAKYSDHLSPLDWNRWSVSLLYSYTAFDPVSETNQLQVQLSFSF